MKTGYKVYKLLEVIEMPEDTRLHMINGEDYTINKNGELVCQDGNKLPISKKNIDTCEFTIIEELKNYNFRVYKDNILIQCFNKVIEESRAGILVKDLYDTHKDKDEEEYFFRMCNYEKEPPLIYMPRHIIDVQVEEIFECK